jgi:hypothetical protein
MNRIPSGMPSASSEDRTLKIENPIAISAFAYLSNSAGVIGMYNSSGVFRGFSFA